MGKKKGGGPKRAFKKDPVATKVAGVKKSKTRAVSTNLKRMNFQNRAQTEAVDAQFTQLQQLKREKKAERSGAAKSEAERALQSEATKSRPKLPGVEEEPDVDMAAEEFSKLASAM